MRGQLSSATLPEWNSPVQREAKFSSPLSDAASPRALNESQHPVTLAQMPTKANVDSMSASAPVLLEKNTSQAGLSAGRGGWAAPGKWPSLRRLHTHNPSWEVHSSHRSNEPPGPRDFSGWEGGFLTCHTPPYVDQMRRYLNFDGRRTRRWFRNVPRKRKKKERRREERRRLPAAPISIAKPPDPAVVP